MSKSCGLNFSDKVVLVTGSSSGIGAATAVLFAKLGANVVVTGRNVENIKKVEAKCKAEKQCKVFAIQADLSNEADVQKLMESTIKHFGKLDVLVNNAGIFEPNNLQNGNLPHLDKIFGTNVRAVYQLTNLAIPHLLKTKGNIINISSVAGLRAYDQYLAYCMSKAALDQFTKCISLELAPQGVRVNSINPGLIITEIIYRSGLPKDEIDKLISQHSKLHPIGRAGQPEEVADLIAFLASEKAGFITGGIYTIDGGYTNACPR